MTGSFLLLFFMSFTLTQGSPTFQTTYVPMRDGVELAVDYVESITKRLPVILELTPYGRGPKGVNYRYEATYWLEHGYIFVIADCRGTGDSKGEMEFFSREGQDGYDLVEWIARQSWSNGRIGMRGSSYTGTNQWFIAREQPPHLSCITPTASLGSSMQDVPYFDGAFAVNWAISWINNSVNLIEPSLIGQSHPDRTTWLNHRPLRTLDYYATGKILPLYRTFLDHPTYDSFWRDIDFKLDDFARITIPSLAFTGWFDGTMYGTIWRFQEARSYAPRYEDQFLIVGPYTHTNAPDGGYDYQTGKPMNMVGDLHVPDNALLPGFNMTHDFFNWCLKDGPRPQWKPARIFVTGSNRWIIGDSFPPPSASKQSLFLTSRGHANSIKGDGRLQWTLPNFNATDSYRYDPANPVRSDINKSIDLPIDINSYLDRNDILVYTTEPLSKSVTIAGDVIVELFVSSTARDTDFVVQLMDVMTDGRSIKLGSKTAGQLRARYRYGFDREVLMSPNQTYSIRINLHAIGHTFLPNHRIRLAITSSFFPWINANPNTGASIALDIQSPLTAIQTIYHTNDQSSRIRLMIVD